MGKIFRVLGLIYHKWEHFEPLQIAFNKLIRHSMQASAQQELQPPVLAPTTLWFLPVERSQHKGPCWKLDDGLPSNLPHKRKKETAASEGSTLQNLKEWNLEQLQQEFKQTVALFRARTLTRWHKFKWIWELQILKLGSQRICDTITDCHTFSFLLSLTSNTDWATPIGHSLKVKI